VKKIKPMHKFKIFKYDAAPFFFYIEIFPPDLNFFKKEYFKKLLEPIIDNPIMPIPMRVDRVFNGENSILIRPREPIYFSFMDDYFAYINPVPFLQYGFKKLLYFTEIRAYEKFVLSLTQEKVRNWWNSTQFLYSKLIRLEEDFSAFHKAYIQTVLKAKINNEDLISAATEYCKIIQDICEKRINENSILIETTRKENFVKLYQQRLAKYRKKMKRVEQTELHPELVDIDVFDLSERGFNNTSENNFSFLDELKPKELKYIPLLFYDDLLECMLQNLLKLEDGDQDILDPSFLIDNKIIILSTSEELENVKLQGFSWLISFEAIDLEPFVESIKNIKLEYYKSVQQEHTKKN
jgi:hypothetical protein